MNDSIIQLTIAMGFGSNEAVVHPTLLRDAHNIILVDCGFIGSLPLLERELRRHGLEANELTGLVLTHHDHDHMGAAAALKRLNPQMNIYTSSAEEPYVSAREKPLRLCQAEEMQQALPPAQQEFGRFFCDMLRRVEPVSVDCVLEDGQRLDWCGGCRVIATPGHTPGHLSLLVENESAIIVGDALALEDGVPVIANPQFTLDMEQARKSMDKLLSYHAAAYYCCHGGVYTPQ